MKIQRLHRHDALPVPPSADTKLDERLVTGVDPFVRYLRAARRMLAD